MSAPNGLAGRIENPDEREIWLELLKAPRTKRLEEVFRIAEIYKVNSLISLSAALRLISVERVLLQEVADLLPDCEARDVLRGRVLTLGRFLENLKLFADDCEERMLMGENEPIEKFDRRLANMAMKGEDQ